jgi:hypothetical protein
MTSDASSMRLTSNIPLKTKEDNEAAAKFFNDTIQWAGWNAMPEHKMTLEAYNCPIKIKLKIEEKRRLHREWHRLQTPASKGLLKAATQELLHDNKNYCIQTFLQGLTPTESTDYSLWRATKKLKHVKKTFSAIANITRNLGEKQHRKSTCFR